jgi:hypothetical protein
MSDAERQATQAEAILANPVWQQAWDTLERELWGLFQDMPPEHVEGLKGIALRRWALVTIRAELERVMARPLLDKLNAE